MRKGLYALPLISAGLLPLAASAADVCTRISGKGLMDGVCTECFNEGRCQIADLFIVGNTVIKLILGLSGSFMLLMVIYGGFLWLSSAGNSDRVGKGKKALISSVIGLAIVFGAYTSMQFLVAALVCKGGESCTVVDDIFARPFKAVKQPSSSSATTPSSGASSTGASGNPTAGTATPGKICDCLTNITGSSVSASTCSAASVSGITCQFTSTPDNICSCSGNLQVGEANCNADGFKSTVAGSVPGIAIGGDCTWKDASSQ